MLERLHRGAGAAWRRALCGLVFGALMSWSAPLPAERTPVEASLESVSQTMNLQDSFTVSVAVSNRTRRPIRARLLAAWVYLPRGRRLALRIGHVSWSGEGNGGEGRVAPHSTATITASLRTIRSVQTHRSPWPVRLLLEAGGRRLVARGGSVYALSRCRSCGGRGPGDLEDQ